MSLISGTRYLKLANKTEPKNVNKKYPGRDKELMSGNFMHTQADRLIPNFGGI